MMKKYFLNLLALLIIGITISSCDSENSCDETCAAGEILTIDCFCVIDANDIVPHPCPDITCPAGQVLTVQGNSCACVDLMSDPCAGVTCDPGFLCLDGDCIFDESTQSFNKSGLITADETWTTGDVYILEDRVTVVEGVTLTIQPGVVIKGSGGTGANASALLIARGAQIMAMGTAEQPIIMTSAADGIQPGEFVGTLDPTVPGLWGGLIVLGNAPISASNDSGDISEVQIEGIPTSDPNGLYGGDDANDNSGIMRYVSLRHGGANIGEGNEINGITLGGVGAGTTIENVEVVANQDDGIEWFGGTVNVTNALLWNCGDDSMDTDQAWNGTCSNFIIVTPAGGSAFELDGPEGTLSQGPATFTNGIVYAGGDIDHLVDWDDSTNCGINNVYFFGVEADYDAKKAFESYGGDGTGTTGMIEYTIPAGLDEAAFIKDAAGDAATNVAELMNTIGADATSFAWTFAAQSGGLASIGL